jgi:hypothetical protein
MINSLPPPETSSASEEESVETILRSGPNGALVVAGIATLVVLALWLAFYFLVFLPRGGLQ